MRPPTPNTSELWTVLADIGELVRCGSLEEEFAQKELAEVQRALLALMHKILQHSPTGVELDPSLFPVQLLAFGREGAGTTNHVANASPANTSDLWL